MADNKDEINNQQHFIELDSMIDAKGQLYTFQLLTDEWISPVKDDDIKALEAPAPPVIIVEDHSSFKSGEIKEGLFPTEVDEAKIREAKEQKGERPTSQTHSRMSEIGYLAVRETDFNSQDGDRLELDSQRDKALLDSKIWENYYSQGPKQIREELLERANVLYQEGIKYFNEGNFEKTISLLNKAFTLNSFNIQFYLLKIESFIQLCDFKSSLITINKLLSILSVWSKNEPRYNELKLNLLSKTAFCHYAQGQTFFDYKLYLEALESFNKASELLPSVINYKIRSILCLFYLGRLRDALLYLNKILSESSSDQEEYRCNLLVLRARIHIKNYDLTEAWLDLKKAVQINPNSREATTLASQIQETADQLRNSALSLSLQDRTQEALNKMTSAITMNPDDPEYNLQRGILYKKIQDFNSAIDDFLLGLDKMNQENLTDADLFNSFQRHILLTYNDFAIVCYRKKLYDDAITLLNKAIKIEKNEKGFYINRGDCFYKKQEIHFALGDYEQAVEIDPSDEVAKSRIAMIHYNIAVDNYNEKDYEKSTDNFNIAIQNAPKVCKYYISRARTFYMLDRIEQAQMDICISILLDPSSKLADTFILQYYADIKIFRFLKDSEIPQIISRIFDNKNLNDVLASPKMSNAKYYLNKLNIEPVLKEFPKEVHIEKKEKSDKKFHLFPNLTEIQAEQKRDLALIEKKKELRRLLKETELPQFVDKEKPTLRPEYTQMAPKKNRDPNTYYWKKFTGGIGGRD